MQGISRDKRTKAVIQRLDRLTLREARMTTAEILKVVYGLVQDMSKQTYYTCLALGIEYEPFPLDGKASGDTVQEALGTFYWQQRTCSIAD